MSENILDHPEVLSILFHPRRGVDFTSNGVSVPIEVEPGLSLSAYLHEAGDSAPLILFFHGNGEIAADYATIGPMYAQLGISFLIIDYRGYGMSGGQPTTSNQLTDAVAVFEQLDDILAANNVKPAKIYVMGRSLGSASAIEVAHKNGDQLGGIIIESGFANTFSLISRLGGLDIDADDATMGYGNTAKIEEITIPTLIIHGMEDYLIPASDGQTLHDRSAAADKRIVLVPRAGHNDLMLVGMAPYFNAVNDFVK
ncbi:MAG: alpha/beta fold hydrolase [Anaerolineae bacterium]|nr:alpha/beta fold hydrolase [Anaerolineae bacterium]